MNLYIPLDTVLVLLTIAYMNSMLLVLAASNVGLAIIEALEDVND